LPWGDVTVPQYLFTVDVNEVRKVALVELLKDPVEQKLSKAVKKVAPLTSLVSHSGKPAGAGSGIIWGVMKLNPVLNIS
jgi:hypothetical protein